MTLKPLCPDGFVHTIHPGHGENGAVCWIQIEGFQDIDEAVEYSEAFFTAGYIVFDRQTLMERSLLERYREANASDKVKSRP